MAAKDIDRAALHTKMAAEVAREMRAKLPPEVGFLVITFDYGNTNSDSRMGYVSTGKREDCIKLVHEFLRNFESN